MKTCSTCGHVQNEGNFCGKCGGKLEGAVDVQAATVAEEQRPVQQSSEQLEKLKQQSKMYFGYFMQQLKTPSGQSDLKNSLISIGLYILLTVIAVYSLINRVFSSSYFFEGPSFMQIFFYAAIFFIVLYAIGVTSVFLTGKFFSENLSYKEVINKFGGYYALPIVLSIVGIVFSFLKSYSIATICIYFGLIVAFGLIPVFVMIKQLSLKSKGIDSFYAYMFYLVLNAIFGALIGLIIADSAIGEMLRYL